MILIDSRAGSKDLIAHEPLKSRAELTVLNSGDACLSGNGANGPVLVGVEAKHVSDMVQSIQTGRLSATQLPALVATYDVRYLLLIGLYRPNPATNTLQLARTWPQKGNPTRLTVEWYDYNFGVRPVPYSYLARYLCSPAFTCLNVSVAHVVDDAAAAVWIGELAATWAKPWANHNCTATFDKSADPPQHGMDDATYMRAKIASCLPGLGYGRAVEAAYHFPTVRAMVNATAEQWAEVPKIGKVIARSVTKAIGDS